MNFVETAILKAGLPQFVDIFVAREGAHHVKAIHFGDGFHTHFTIIKILRERFVSHRVSSRGQNSNTKKDK